MRSLDYSGGFTKRVVTLSFVSIIVTTLPLHFLALWPWSGDTISNEAPVLFTLLSTHHLPSEPITKSLIPFYLLGVIGSVLGLEPGTLLLTAPPLLFAVGGLVFGLATKNFLEDETAAVYATALYLTFGPVVYWVSQGVRESYGLALTPWVFWGLVSFLPRLKPNDLRNRLLMAGVMISFTFILLTHHWTTLMVLLLLAPSILFLTFSNQDGGFSHVVNRKPLSVTISFAALFFTYWVDQYEHIGHLLVVGSIKLATALFHGESNTGGSATLDGGLLTHIQSILVFSRPPQMFLSLGILVVIAGLGVLLALLKRNMRVIATGVSASLLASVAAAGILRGGNFGSFDPLRVLEFLTYPGAIAGGYFLSAIVGKFGESSRRFRTCFFSVIVVILTISAIVFFPTPYYTGVQLSPDHPGYDIRGDKFYANEYDASALDFTLKYESEIFAPGVVLLNQHAKYLNNPDGPCVIWRSESTQRIQSARSQIVAEKFSIRGNFSEIYKRGDVIYDNSYGQIHTAPNNQRLCALKD